MQDKFEWEYKVKVKKPSFIPFRVNPAPNKTLDIKKIFGDVLATKLSDTPKEQQEHKTQSGNHNKNLAVTKALLDMVKMSQQYLHLHGSHLAKIDQTQSYSNFEAINRADYKNFNNLLHHGIAGALIEDNKKKKTIKNDHENIDIGVEGQNPHDINPYFGFSSILPFKKGSSIYKNFKESSLFQLFDSNFHSTLRALGKNMWEEHTEIIKNVQEKAVNFKHLPDPFLDNKSAFFDIRSGYKSVINNPLVWEDFSQEESFHFILNRHDRVKQYSSVLRSVLGKHINQLENIKLYEKKLHGNKKDQLSSTEILDSVLDISFELISNFDTLSEDELAENLLNVESILNENYEKIDETLTYIDKNKDLFSSEELEEIEELKRSNETLITELNTYNLNVSKILNDTRTEKPNFWIENVGNHLDQLPFFFMYNIFLEAAPLVSKEINIGLRNDDSDLRQFQSKIINDYTNHLNKILFNQLTPTGIVTENDLKIDNIMYGQKLLTMLKNADIISQDGTINEDKFNVETLSLNTNWDEDEEIRIRKILKNKLLGHFSFDVIDKTKINNDFRENIKMITPDGEKIYLKDLMNSILDGKTDIEKYENAKKSYSILMDMYESMTGLSSRTEGSNMPLITENNGSYSLAVYPKAEWFQKTNETDIDLLSGLEKKTWETISDQPLIISSKKKENLTNFFKTIETMILQLEPLVSTFAPQDNAIIKKENLSYQDSKIVSLPIRVLIDNVGDIENNHIVTAGSQHHKFSIDTLFNPTYFETNDFQTKSVTTRNMLNYQVGKNIFSKGVVNGISRIKHKTDKENYKKESEKAKEEVYEEKKQEHKAYLKKIAKRKAENKKAENKKLTEKIELENYIKKMNNIKQSQNAIRKKLSSKKKKASRKK